MLEIGIYITLFYHVRKALNVSLNVSFNAFRFRRCVQKKNYIDTK